MNQVHVTWMYFIRSEWTYQKSETIWKRIGSQFNVYIGLNLAWDEKKINDVICLLIDMINFWNWKHNRSNDVEWRYMAVWHMVYVMCNNWSVCGEAVQEWATAHRNGSGNLSNTTTRNEGQRWNKLCRSQAERNWDLSFEFGI